jgi:hypothetical protein
LPHDYGLLWLENAFRFGVLKNEKNEYFVNKYLTTNQIMLSIVFHNMQNPST